MFSKKFAQTRLVGIVLSPRMSKVLGLVRHMVAKFCSNDFSASRQMAVRKVGSHGNVKQVRV